MRAAPTGVGRCGFTVYQIGERREGLNDDLIKFRLVSDCTRIGHSPVFAGYVRQGGSVVGC